MIAALYVQTNGVYYGLDDVDPWDEERDARLYDGPWPVVAHPPCTSWSAWRAPTRETMYGAKVGDDGGCFDAALNAVRRFGGVLEHPAHSLAWRDYSLPEPVTGGWILSMYDGIGWVIEVSQADYGHRGDKPTWLYYVGHEPPILTPATIRPPKSRPTTHMSHSERSATPLAFRDVLLDMARSVEMVAA